ncbi:MAG TPA: DUF6456 domain-containing protein [Xanthobacteraceae bacterium]|nr:DUF6456 domain-containing protein [Xanthobacteraceae bacterium]
MTRNPNGTFALSAAGLAWVARRNAELRAEHIDPFIAQHLDITAREINEPEGRRPVVMDDSESPLVWLARRKSRNGQPMIAPHQLAAGERLRVEFTHTHMMPRVTSNWDAAVSQGGRDGGRTHAADTMVAARQRVRQTLNAVGPEFSGLLLDVCCFLKGLEDIERERLWPARSAKVVLQLGLDRLARHYGLDCEARGKARASLRAWSGSEASGVPGG